MRLIFYMVLPIDVFSFGDIALYAFGEEWPAPSGSKTRDLVTKRLRHLLKLSDVKNTWIIDDR